MNKTLRIYLISSIVVMLILPCIVSIFRATYEGMAAGLILIYGVNPIFCAVVGGLAGADIKRRWYWPLATAALFVAGAWTFYAVAALFVIYALIYLAISATAMGAVALIIRYRNGKKQ